MYLVRLIYASSITNENFIGKNIEELLVSARKNNKENNVTGMLCFNSNFFLQCLEGSRASVNKTYHRILSDKRHHDPLLLDYQEISVREFTDWEMGYVPYSKLTNSLISNYSGAAEFEPINMKGESCHQMLLALRDSVPTI